MKSQPNSITPEKREYHAQILSNRVRNRYAHLSRRFRKRNIDCFRLYDWDIPEVRAVIDWYAGHLVIAEYVRWQTGPQWLGHMASAVAARLGVPSEKVHLKRRRTNTKEGPRYVKEGASGKRFKVREGDLQFWINLDDQLDTGLFSDHRNTRLMIKDLARGKDFLNLYGYTGAFTCAAASGGARSSVTVDRSGVYLDWARDNLKLNGLWGARHTLVKSDVGNSLEKALRTKMRFDLAFVDPPSFFKDRKRNISMDISRDHPQLLRDVCKVMAPGSEIFFSSNHQRFEPHFDGLPVEGIIEITPKSIPEDYRNRRVHRCWRMRVL
jgi:23S rRNA (cytosine1962-C5)-methyltransferase